MLYRSFLWLWMGGLVLFAIVIALSLPLTLTAVPGGISDHQSAGTAQAVNDIHAAWKQAGLMGQARVAMLADLLFIGVYGLGSILGGLHFRKTGTGAVRRLGVIIALSGVAFFITDYVETISQLIQLTRDAGDNQLAALAATVKPVKMVAWVITFLGMLLALAITHKTRPGA